MKEEVHAPGCERENDLIAFLYGELDPGERTAFRGHLQDCRSCSLEFAEFTNIRESVVAWRNEALVGVTSPAIQASPILRTGRSGPTALTALREFFNLSPLWMKGAVVFVSLLFCLFAVLAAARLRKTPPAPVATNPTVKGWSEQEFNAVVAQRVQDELQRIKKSSELAIRPPTNAKGVPVRASANTTSNRGNEVANIPQLKARRPLSKVERQQLAADLRLIAGPTEGDLDLLDDRINQ
jgi:anti-sigma factor RsiW